MMMIMIFIILYLNPIRFKSSFVLRKYELKRGTVMLLLFLKCKPHKVDSSSTISVTLGASPINTLWNSLIIQSLIIVGYMQYSISNAGRLFCFLGGKTLNILNLTHLSLNRIFMIIAKNYGYISKYYIQICDEQNSSKIPNLLKKNCPLVSIH